MPTAGSYRYKLANGQEVQYGDPTINTDALAGATYLGKQGDAGAEDPLIEHRRKVAAAQGTTPEAASAVTPRTIDPNTAAAETFLNTFKQPETEAQIVERKRKESASLIEAIDTKYNLERQRKQQLGQERLSMDNAAAVLSGLMGSSDAGRSREKVLRGNEEEIKAVEANRAIELAGVYAKISDSAREEARQQLEDATRSADQIVARKKAAQESALANIKTMASSGLVDFEAFRSNPQNAEVFKYALDAAGSEETLRALFAINRPQDQLVGSPTRMGNKYVQAYKNPLSGKVSFEALDLPVELGAEYSTFQKLGDNLVAIPDGWDGDTSKLRTIVGQPTQEDLLRRQSLMLDIQKKQRELNGSPDGGSSAGMLATQITFLRDTIADAKKLSSASGASGLSKSWGDTLIGDTRYRRLEAMTNTLRTNVLTLVSDPDIKKFFGPQMSELDVRLMTSAGTTLNPENQSPDDLRKELDRLDDLFIRVQASLPADTPTPTANLSSQLQPGEILVRDKKSGQIGAVPEGEYDASLYERM